MLTVPSALVEGEEVDNCVAMFGGCEHHRNWVAVTLNRMLLSVLQEFSCLCTCWEGRARAALCVGLSVKAPLCSEQPGKIEFVFPSAAKRRVVG